MKKVTKKDIKEFYNKFKAGELNKWDTKYEVKGILNQIFSLINFEEYPYILDVGCGTGYKTREYLKRAKKSKFVAIDYSNYSIIEAIKKSKRLDNLRFEVGDAENLRFKDKTFDLVVSSEVLEHLLQPQKMLNEVNGVLKRNGNFIITTPNPWNINLIYFRLKQVFYPLIGKERPKKKQIIDNPISPIKLNKMIKNAGFVIIKRKGSYYIPPLVSKIKFFYNMFYSISQFIEKHGLFPYFGLYQIILTTKENKRVLTNYKNNMHN